MSYGIRFETGDAGGSRAFIQGLSLDERAILFFLKRGGKYHKSNSRRYSMQPYSVFYCDNEVIDENTILIGNKSLHGNIYAYVPLGVYISENSRDNRLIIPRVTKVTSPEQAGLPLSNWTKLAFHTLEGEVNEVYKDIIQKCWC